MSKIKVTIEISHPALDECVLFDAFQEFIEGSLELSEMIEEHLEDLEDEEIEETAKEMEEALREELSQALCVSLISGGAA
jgi:hypothetical protein|tara:strand:+ start:49 stop:288 length:240 start_codon:yes stop_codon:yes gene_type:complete